MASLLFAHDSYSTNKLIESDVASTIVSKHLAIFHFIIDSIILCLNISLIVSCNGARIHLFLGKIGAVLFEQFFFQHTIWYKLPAIILCCKRKVQDFSIYGLKNELIRYSNKKLCIDCY